jgi:diaminopimelate decarboxylase
VKSGDLVAIFGAGAYGMAMSSTYNSRPRAAEVLVNSGKTQRIRKRESYRDLVRGE